ncbi:MAG: C40 family peptidase [Crocinitomicaceae bacterium]|nr:C40 family peptidase [Crocinitomicaceae bacterium]
MKWAIAIIGFIVLNQSVLAQDKKIDQLEILYDQGYYRKVLRKSRKLLAHPEYDYSGLPSYYQALALFRLYDDPKWRKHHKTALSDAVESYETFVEHPSYNDYIHAHYYEIAGLKSYLEKLEGNLADLGFPKDAGLIRDFSLEYFISIKAKPDTHENLGTPDNTANESTAKAQRDRIVDYAKTLVGIKYVWAGADESGFDCSGFTSYVLKKYGFYISRTASGQLEEARKVKLNNAYKGDLVFFGSGAKITHVGLVVNDKGNQLVMIHASTSKGVIVTDIENSTYWKPKLKAAGTYLD